MHDVSMIIPDRSMRNPENSLCFMGKFTKSSKHYKGQKENKPAVPCFFSQRNHELTELMVGVRKQPFLVKPGPGLKETPPTPNLRKGTPLPPK